ncbi:MAG TPA: alpha/beta hydrolase [Chloroflexota bacterium]|jgi:ssDNA-binding replication factor A large subunit|nr:alpha/beta hydrolase [Chloroflexota bacterium]
MSDTLVHVTNAPRPEAAYELLSERYRVVTRDEGSTARLAETGSDRINVWGSDAALRLALDAPDAIEALILEAPAAPADLDRLAGLNVPTLVVYGTRDTVTAPATGRVYRQTLPNCNYVLVYNAGHEIAVDRPEAFVSLVADFLERREAFIVTQKSSLLHP